MRPLFLIALAVLSLMLCLAVPVDGLCAPPVCSDGACSVAPLKAAKAIPSRLLSRWRARSRCAGRC